METKKLVGLVTPEERDEIQQLFERRNGLNELAKILTADNTELYEKLVKDLARLAHDSKHGGTAWETSISGKAPRVVTGR